MTDNDIILAKVNNIQNCLRRVNQVASIHPNAWDYDTQDIIVLNLQRAVQATIDIAAHIVSHENLGLASSLKDLFACLEKNGIIEHSIAEKMKKMVGFRNIAVHDYQEIDSDILMSVVKHHLGDFEAYYKAIITYTSKKTTA